MLNLEFKILLENVPGQWRELKFTLKNQKKMLRIICMYNMALYCQVLTNFFRTYDRETYDLRTYDQSFRFFRENMYFTVSIFFSYQNHETMKITSTIVLANSASHSIRMSNFKTLNNNLSHIGSRRSTNQPQKQIKIISVLQTVLKPIVPMEFIQ